MRTPVALVAALGLYWMGLNQGAEAPGGIVRDFWTLIVVLTVAAVAWELVARRLRARRATPPAT